MEKDRYNTVKSQLNPSILRKKGEKRQMKKYRTISKFQDAHLQKIKAIKSRSPGLPLILGANKSFDFPVPYFLQ